MFDNWHVKIFFSYTEARFSTFQLIFVASHPSTGQLWGVWLCFLCSFPLNPHWASSKTVCFCETVQLGTLWRRLITAAVGITASIHFNKVHAAVSHGRQQCHLQLLLFPHRFPQPEIPINGCSPTSKSWGTATMLAPALQRITRITAQQQQGEEKETTATIIEKNF